MRRILILSLSTLIAFVSAYSNFHNMVALSGNFHLVQSKPAPTPSAIKDRFDFANFTFPPIKDWARITLTNGKSNPSFDPNGKISEPGFSLVSQSHGVMSNGKNCAAAVLSVQTGGSAIIYLVYVFDISNNTPKFIRSFESGDRADGGLRKVYFIKANLIIESYESEEAAGDCCPRTYRKSFYSFQRDRLVLLREENNLPNPQMRSVFIGPDR